ncbi:hypothetical protein WOC76_10820 [Methylocystis sp. IM3]|jgi:hypothetical protein|uniref:hypothetical protein n=1 Tax=Methylocystis sp. IM3 TaxID=3136722 RepID=UPI0031199BA4
MKLKHVVFAHLLAAFLFSVSTPAAADRYAASCSDILNVSSSEADFLYYDARTELGSETALRLWNGYHRLKYACARNPGAKMVVNLSPRVRAFLESR